MYIVSKGQKWGCKSATGQNQGPPSSLKDTDEGLTHIPKSFLREADPQRDENCGLQPGGLKLHLEAHRPETWRPLSHRTLPTLSRLLPDAQALLSVESFACLRVRGSDARFHGIAVQDSGEGLGPVGGKQVGLLRLP